MRSVLESYADDFETSSADSLLTKNFFLAEPHDSESSLCRSQMSRSLYAANSENRTHSDFFVRSKDSILLSSHIFSFIQAIIDSADLVSKSDSVSKSVADLCTCV